MEPRYCFKKSTCDSDEHHKLRITALRQREGQKGEKNKKNIKNEIRPKEGKIINGEVELVV